MSATTRTQARATEPTREQDAAIERVAVAAGSVRVERLAGGNVRVTVIIDPDGETVETSQEEA